MTDAGLMAILSASDPSIGGVAPHGGRRGLYTPNPIAAAWPTDGDPVMLDVSMSITTHGMVRRAQREKRRLPGPWLIDAQGNATDDPAVVLASPPGALLPIGGLDHGHKGYALGLLVEALTGGLAGRGRADPTEGWTANVFLQVFDPALFGGRDDFIRQTRSLDAGDDLADRFFFVENGDDDGDGHGMDYTESDPDAQGNPNGSTKNSP